MKTNYVFEHPHGAAVLYDGRRVDGSVLRLGRTFHADGRVEPLEAPRIETFDVLVERINEHPEREVLLELGACTAEDDVVAVVRPP